MIFFNKKKKSDDYVELNLKGPIKTKIFLFELTNGMANTIISKSTLVKSMMNENYMLQLFEYVLYPGGKKKVDRLTLNNGQILRNKVKEILVRNNIIEIQINELPEKVVQENANIFHQSDVEWFNKEAVDGMERAKKNIIARGKR